MITRLDRKILGLLLCGALLFSLVGAAPASAEIREGGYAILQNPNSANRLNLRLSAAENSQSLGQYYTGVTVKILSLPNAEWARIAIGGESGQMTGYMMRKYLADPTAAVASFAPIVQVHNPYSNVQYLFKLPNGTVSNLVMALPNGTAVTVLGMDSAYAHVQANGVTGFVPLSVLPMNGMTAPTASPYPYFYPTATPAPTARPSFNGPVGYHKTAAWPLPVYSSSRVAVVNNPNPSDRLNLRETPSESARSLGKYYNGVRVTVNSTLEGDWVGVSIGGLNGYMKRQYLAFGSNEPLSVMPVMTVSNPNAVGNLHLRAGQSTSTASLGLYANGTEVILMGFTSEWAHVIVNGQMGFMMAKYLK